MSCTHEHAARMENPEDFIRTTFRRKTLSPGTTIIVAKKKEDGNRGSLKVQSYRFDVCKYTPAKAKSWLKKYDVTPKKFEKATCKCGEKR